MFAYVIMEDKLSACTLQNTPGLSLFDVKAPCRILAAHDGDTVKAAVVIDGRPAVVTCRICNVDTPEMRPPSAAVSRKEQIGMAHRARNHVVAWLSDARPSPDIRYTDLQIENMLHESKRTVFVHLLKTDKYGRVLANFYKTKEDMESRRHDLSGELVRLGLAKEYSGGKKEVWGATERNSCVAGRPRNGDSAICGAQSIKTEGEPL
jgi:hypothetical protein